MNTLLLDNVTVRMTGSLVLDAFSLQAETGEVIFITGDNGSGKSTLLKVIAGYLKPDSGSVFLSGKINTSYSVSEWHRHVHYLPQQNQLAFPVTVKELLVMAFYRDKKWHEPYASGHYKKVEAMAERFGVTLLLNRNAKELSGGELQLCWLIQSFLAGPDVLLLDEPTQYLDATNRSAFFTILKEQVAIRPFICLCSTHDLPFMKESYGRVVHMQKSRS